MNTETVEIRPEVLALIDEFQGREGVAGLISKDIGVGEEDDVIVHLRMI